MTIVEEKLKEALNLLKAYTVQGGKYKGRSHNDLTQITLKFIKDEELPSEKRNAHEEVCP